MSNRIYSVHKLKRPDKHNGGQEDRHSRQIGFSQQFSVFMARGLSKGLLYSLAAGRGKFDQATNASLTGGQGQQLPWSLFK